MKIVTQNNTQFPKIEQDHFIFKINDLFQMNRSFVLKIKINDPEMISYYENHRHAYAGDSGIDIYVSDDVIVPPQSLATRIPTSVQLELCDSLNGVCSSYMVVARSSIYRTPLRLSQAISIIDAGFRGELYFFVDNLSNQSYQIKKGHRLFQIIAPNLTQMHLKIVDELSPGTRMYKGLGSSGLAKL